MSWRRWGAALAVSAAAMLGAAPAFAAWLKAESPRFVVYSDGSEKDLREYVQLLEAYDFYLRKQYRVADEPDARKFPIYLVRNIDDLRRIRPGASEGTLGIYFPILEEVFAVAVRDRDSNLAVLHEYAHHFMLARFPDAYPAWLVEGWAEYYGAFRLDSRGRFVVGQYDPNRASWVMGSQWLPMKDLLGKTGADLRDGEQVAMFYAQSWALAHYFLGDVERAKQLDAYLKHVKSGKGSVEAMELATGDTAGALERRLRTYLNRGIPTRTWDFSGVYTAPEVSIERLPAWADDLLLEARQVPAGEAENRVKRLAAKAAKHRGERVAELALAEAEIHGGDRAAGIKLLRDWLARSPDDVEALQKLADGLLHRVEDEKLSEADSKALRDEARKLLGKANTLRQDDPVTLAYFARARRFDPDYPTRNTLDVLLRAFSLAPQAPDLRFEAAEALFLSRRFDEAIAVIRPLAFSPHPSESTKAAHALLTAAENGLEKIRGEEAATGAGSTAP